MSTDSRAPQIGEALDARPGEGADLVLREATVLDPVAGIEGSP